MLFRSKKFGTITVTLLRKVGRYTNASFSCDLRLDEKGWFYAAHDGRWYKAQTQDALREELRAAVEVTADVEWTRYLVVRYKATARPVGSSGWGSYKTLDIEDDRAEELRPKRDASRWGDSEHEVVGIDLAWEVKEFSTTYKRPEDGKLVQLRRDVDADGDVGEPDEQDPGLPAGAVVWSEKREAVLREVRAAIARLDARLVEFFRGEPDDLARSLDAVDATKLLPAGEGETQQKVRGNRG